MSMRRSGVLATAISIALTVGLAPGAAMAAVDTGDTAWMLTSTALVLFMTLPGLALFYAGLVRARNMVSVLQQVFAIACVVSVAWVLVGYALAFGVGNPYVGGLAKAFLRGVGADAEWGTMPETVFMMYQMTFAIITPALIVGAYVERIRFAAVLLFSLLWVLVVYAPVAHWVWAEGGWLFEMGVRDFAGGLVVHTTAGISALLLAVMLGARKGFPQEMKPPHNPSLTMIGAAMLWVGWFGFNAGSSLGAGAGAGMAMAVTHISAATAATVWMFIEWWRLGKPSMVGTVTGAVAGLATITPASGFVGPVGALIIGVCASVICYGVTQWVKKVRRIDDSLDVFAVHGVGGMTGVLLTSFLASETFQGLGLTMSMGEHFGVQLIGVVAVALWSGVASFVLIKITQATVGLRVSREDEAEGLDITAHGERAYEL